MVLDGTRAVSLGLHDDGANGPEWVHAERITLAGGAIGTRAILLRSGIGPGGELRALGMTPTVDLAGVGANLIDHAARCDAAFVTAELCHANASGRCTW